MNSNIETTLKEVNCLACVASLIIYQGGRLMGW
jgi:hypothetical protein